MIIDFHVYSYLNIIFSDVKIMSIFSNWFGTSFDGISTEPSVDENVESKPENPQNLFVDDDNNLYRTYEACGGADKDWEMVEKTIFVGNLTSEEAKLIK